MPERHCSERTAFLFLDAGMLQFNARSESVLDKSIFSRLLAHRRCIVMVEGFFEWKQVGSYSLCFQQRPGLSVTHPEADTIFQVL